MKFIKTYNEIILTKNSYEYKKVIIGDDFYYHIIYEFITESNENYEVEFRQISNVSYGKREKPLKWTREFVTKESGYRLTNSKDVFKVMATVSEITIDFLNSQECDILKIEHIPTPDEILNQAKDYGWGSGLNIENKRARINKMFLKKYLSKNNQLAKQKYDYKLSGSISIITKVNN